MLGSLKGEEGDARGGEGETERGLEWRVASMVKGVIKQLELARRRNDVRP